MDDVPFCLPFYSTFVKACASLKKKEENCNFCGYSRDVLAGKKGMWMHLTSCRFFFFFFFFLLLLSEETFQFAMFYLPVVDMESLVFQNFYRLLFVFLSRLHCHNFNLKTFAKEIKRLLGEELQW